MLWKWWKIINKTNLWSPVLGYKFLPIWLRKNKNSSTVITSITKIFTLSRSICHSHKKQQLNFQMNHKLISEIPYYYLQIPKENTHYKNILVIWEKPQESFLLELFTFTSLHKVVIYIHGVKIPAHNYPLVIPHKMVHFHWKAFLLLMW